MNMKKIRSGMRHQQQGLSLLLVLVLLVISISTSLFFHQRMVSSTQISGATRDNSESLMLAESAMEMLRGGFINKLCTLATLADCATVAPATPNYDKDRTGAIIGKMKDAAALETALTLSEVDYLFYVGAADQLSPSILQRAANGGAGIAGASCTVAAGTHAVSAADCNLDVNTLFTGVNNNPLLFTTNANGLLVQSAAANWQAELASANNNSTVAAAWIELTVNNDDPDGTDMWVQSVARVGVAKSYVQRYIGTYYPASTALGSLAGLVESSNINREVTP